MRRRQDHPRIRGEHLHFLSCKYPNSGSPPHTRGTPDVPKAKADLGRITPAYAGNTIFLYPDVLPVWDHPRIRGEHKNSTSGFTGVSGSPPHTRGTLFISSIPVFSPGITPAYAGNTLRLHRAEGHFQDHPRIRGEHSKKIP